MANKHMKRTLYQPSGKFKLKLQRDSVTHPSEELKLKRLMILNVGKDMKRL